MGELLVRYEESGIDERILRAVEEMGFVHMTPIQEKAIPVFLEGRDVIGQAQTGTGKTAAFGIPMLQKIDEEDRIAAGYDPLPDERACDAGGSAAETVCKIYAQYPRASRIRRTGYQQTDQGVKRRRADHRRHTGDA